VRSRPALTRRVTLALALALAAAAWAADAFVVEDWKKLAVGARGIPDGWKGGQIWGNPKYDFTVVDTEGHRVVRLVSDDDTSTITKELKGKWSLKETPILEWSWKLVKLPKGADSRSKSTDDQAAQLYVVWPRFPKELRSRLIGYVWDTTAPQGLIVKSEKTGMVTYVVARSGPAELGRWITERRNVYEDYKKIYGEEPENPGALSIAIDSDDTKSAAEAFIGPITFKKP
jgi:hypothetical protein